jgi:hypothetical protein
MSGMQVASVGKGEDGHPAYRLKGGYSMLRGQFTASPSRTAGPRQKCGAPQQ